jgi:hypothetical protein
MLLAVDEAVLFARVDRMGATEDAAFAGDNVQIIPGGLRSLAELHARSMVLMARDLKDPSIAEQADLLTAILGVTR